MPPQSECQPVASGEKPAPPRHGCERDNRADPVDAAAGTAGNIRYSSVPRGSAGCATPQPSVPSTAGVHAGVPSTAPIDLLKAAPAEFVSPMLPSRAVETGPRVFLAQARRAGVNELIGELPPKSLAELADAARLGGDPELAVRAPHTRNPRPEKYRIQFTPSGFNTSCSAKLISFSKRSAHRTTTLAGAFKTPRTM